MYVYLSTYIHTSPRVGTQVGDGGGGSRSRAGAGAGGGGGAGGGADTPAAAACGAGVGVMDDESTPSDWVGLSQREARDVVRDLGEGEGEGERVRMRG